MSFNTALSGIQAASSDLGIIGNNIANAATTGFKSSRAEFADVFTSIGQGVRLQTAAQQFSQGNIAFTDNPLDLASWVATTKESAFFDVLDTEPIESSHQTMLQALTNTLQYLRSEPTGDFECGFGTIDMSQSLWRYRHYVRFEALLDGFLNGDEYASLTERFEINTGQIPLDDTLAETDRRFGMTWFPRDGDQFCVDAANSGLNGKNFSYSSGPVMRMVIALTEDGVSGVNVIPGGQSRRARS